MGTGCKGESMNDGIVVNERIIIPYAELEITTSRSSGAGGQHVNKTDTRVTLRWNIPGSSAVTSEQKQLLLMHLAPKITKDGDLLISKSESRSQAQNKKSAFAQLVRDIRYALRPTKERIETDITHAARERRKESKMKRKQIKQFRKRPKDFEDV